MDFLEKFRKKISTRAADREHRAIFFVYDNEDLKDYIFQTINIQAEKSEYIAMLYAQCSSNPKSKVPRNLRTADNYYIWRITNLMLFSVYNGLYAGENKDSIIKRLEKYQGQQSIIDALLPIIDIFFEVETSTSEKRTEKSSM